MIDKIEKWWNSLSDTGQLIFVVIAFALICWASPFIK